MKKIIYLIITIVLINTCIINAKNMDQEKKMIFPKGEKGPAEWFTGSVWVNTLMQKTENLNYVIGDVKFEPKARTFWHSHPIEQILLVTEGNGFYQERGKPARAIAKGDIVVIPPHIEHWHGAGHNSGLTHIAITNYKDGKNVEWLTPVTDEEYKSLPE